MASKGWSLFQSLVKFMRDKQNEAGYLEVNTPEMLDKTLGKVWTLGKISRVYVYH